jgi:hypothetical protein
MGHSACKNVEKNYTHWEALSVKDKGEKINKMVSILAETYGI